MKKHLKILSLLLVCIFLAGSISVNAAQIYKEGNSITFHNLSPYYIVDDVWTLGTHTAQMFDGVLYVSLEDFRNAFGVNITYNYEDLSIFTILAEKTLWQCLGYDTMFVGDAPQKVPAPLISPIEPHPVMIPLEAYAKELGFAGTWSESEIYPPGQILLETEKTPYTITNIEVNQAAQLVTVFGKAPNGKVEPVKYMLCSTGVGDATPNGTYVTTPLGKDWYFFPAYNCYVRFCTHLTGDICFHSLTFNEKTNASLSRTAYRDIGKKASHGCVRLFVEDAQFIHQNCAGLKVTITPGYKNAQTDAIRARIISQKLTYEDYVKSLK